MISLPKDKKISEHLYHSLVSVKNQHPAISDWLKSELERIDKATAIEKDEVQLRWKQGARQLLDDLIKSISNSREILEAMKGK